MATVEEPAPRRARRKRREAVARVARPADTLRGRVRWPFVIGVVGFHLLIPLAFVPGYFTWIGVAWLPIGNYLFCSLGIGAGFHRMLTHRGFKCSLWLERTLAVLGICNLQDSPARWVAVHRLHHQHSDDQPDPHTPMVSGFWGHVGWLFVENRQLGRMATYDKYARDILQDRFYLRMERRGGWAWLYLAHAIAFFVVGLAVGWLLSGDYWHGVHCGVLWVLWGVIYRTIYTWHVTWAVNSVAHLYGYRNYDTGENSRNNWLVALLTNGEGWHNNHHADPTSAQHGHRWWELDLTYLSIRGLEKLGLVWDVVLPRRNAKPMTPPAAADVAPAPIVAAEVTR